jgi:hypothetical protein
MTKDYSWVNETLENILETLSTGDPIAFQFNSKDYFLEGDFFDDEGLGRVGSFRIIDPDVQENGDFGGNGEEYPESGKYRTLEDLLSAPFLKGKTIAERFSELKFFD